MEDDGDFGRKITIGVCVMEKKVKSGPEVLFFSCHTISHIVRSHM